MGLKSGPITVCSSIITLFVHGDETEIEIYTFLWPRSILEIFMPILLQISIIFWNTPYFFNLHSFEGSYNQENLSQPWNIPFLNMWYLKLFFFPFIKFSDQIWKCGKKGICWWKFLSLKVCSRRVTFAWGLKSGARENYLFSFNLRKQLISKKEKWIVATKTSLLLFLPLLNKWLM